MCCPDPEKPAIAPDRESLRLRRHLRYVFYGQAAMCIVKALMQGLFAGLFQLFSVWIAFSCWASMYYCTLIF